VDFVRGLRPGIGNVGVSELAKAGSCAQIDTNRFASIGVSLPSEKATIA
jgi:hypothetical protein